MPFTKVFFKLLLICFLYFHARTAICFDLQLPNIRMLRSCKIDKIYQLGDSLSDTGNRIVEDPLNECGSLPYGENFPQGPTGRCSDGMLMIDHIGKKYSIDFLLVTR